MTSRGLRATFRCFWRVAMRLLLALGVAGIVGATAGAATSRQAQAVPTREQAFLDFIYLSGVCYNHTPDEERIWTLTLIAGAKGDADDPEGLGTSGILVKTYADGLADPERETISPAQCRSRMAVSEISSRIAAFQDPPRPAE